MVNECEVVAAIGGEKRNTDTNQDDSKENHSSSKTLRSRRVCVILKETETIFILDLPALTEEIQQPLANISDDTGSTAATKPIKKIAHAEVQTYEVLMKTRSSATTSFSRKHSYAFSSLWDNFDTLKSIEESNKNVLPIDFTKTKSQYLIHHFNLQNPEVENMVDKEIREVEKIMRSLKFKASLLVIKRLLGSNVYRQRQKRYCGLVEQIPYRMDAEYNYRLDLLWTYKNVNTEEKPVSAICWNPSNKNIVAVGYGKFNYTDKQDGLILVWNIKSPTQPEREYNFPCPVTSMDFSRQHPNYLAVGFYNGVVIVLDISEENMKLISESNRFLAKSFEPIWQTRWYFQDDQTDDLETEQLICSSQDGRISRYMRTKTTEMICSPLIRITAVEGTTQGVPNVCRSRSIEVDITRFPAALVVCLHPRKSKIYFVGTDKGCVYKCSLNYPNHHIEVFMAHTGPIYGIEFSPFVKKLFVTCGGDWHIRIWAEGVGSPLMVMRTGFEPVQGICWSPIHSSILTCVCSNIIQVWDLGRKVFYPISKTEADSRITSVHYDPSGVNLFVTTCNGAVSLYTFEDMPYPAYYQEQVLYNIIHDALITNSTLIQELKNIGFFSCSTDVSRR